ncbi:MAG: hypothetical protein P0Y53_17465 [Candidatus Pseudobacter hemicellulosilyticus]|uniref:Uncharacterized protein n=1 Tax=Candidatus Pseudobacter hemicellulosilyticus TaxID=3121375 RepID=A0AAJ6BEQ1_9BACT|nr:MAG: hypothetical protein P0Y53_17465 [Pseudobacter sp.]
MTENEKKFSLYLVVLRFLVYKVTSNLNRIYLDVDLPLKKMVLTAFYNEDPSELELELFDDIVTNSNAHIPDFYINSEIQLRKHLDSNAKYDFIIFATYEND